MSPDPAANRPPTPLAPDAGTAGAAVPPPVAATAERPQTIVLPGQTPAGEHVLSLLLKRTYDVLLGRRCIRAAQDRKLHPADVHYDGPVNSSVKYESDFIPFKVATDVVFLGKAYAPGGRPSEQIPVSISIGAHRKELVVFGDRLARLQAGSGKGASAAGRIVFTEPEPFVTMDLVYERAYGGVDIASNPATACIYPRNHLGRGFVAGEKITEDVPLPNIEDPLDLLTPERLCTVKFWEWEKQPMPQGLAWFAKMWQPRASLAGVMPADRPVEEELRRAYSTVVPADQKEMYEQTRLKDMDFRFFNGASPGLALPYLTGDEEIWLAHLMPEGQAPLRLPGERPKMGLDVGSGVQEPAVVLHTVCIRMEERQVDLVWRGAVPYPGPDWLPQMKKMEVMVQ